MVIPVESSVRMEKERLKFSRCKLGNPRFGREDTMSLAAELRGQCLLAESRRGGRQTANSHALGYIVFLKPAARNLQGV
jgi:hypothetical protein